MFFCAFREFRGFVHSVIQQWNWANASAACLISQSHCSFVSISSLDMFGLDNGTLAGKAMLPAADFGLPQLKATH
jgi:hypothetical protein